MYFYYKQSTKLNHSRNGEAPTTSTTDTAENQAHPKAEIMMGLKQN